VSGPRATLRRTGPAKTLAQLAQALAADDDEYVSTRLEADALVIAVQAADLGALRRALDDVMATLSVSEDVLSSSRMGA
jgi:hypothetical protein